MYSRTLHTPSSTRTRVEREFNASAVRLLKESSASDISVGGAELAGQAMAAGLVDELHLFLRRSWSEAVSVPFPMTFRSSSISWPSVASETASFTSATGWGNEGPGSFPHRAKMPQPQCVNRPQCPSRDW